MSITLRCVCGARFSASDDCLGGRATCPACGQMLAVPSRPTRRPRRADARSRRRTKRGVNPLAIVGIALGAVAVLGFVCFVASRREETEGGGQTSQPYGPSSSGTRAAYREPSGVELPTSYASRDVDRLAAQLGARDLRSRIAAAQAIAAMGPGASEAVPALLDAMARKSLEIELSRVLDKAVKAIGPMAVPGLIAALRAGSPKARFVAATAIAQLGPAAAGAVQPLISVVESDPDYSVRSNAAAALGAIGPGASAALPALRKVGGANTKLTHDPGRAELCVRARVAIDQIQEKAGN